MLLLLLFSCFYLYVYLEHFVNIYLHEVFEPCPFKIKINSINKKMLTLVTRVVGNCVLNVKTKKNDDHVNMKYSPDRGVYNIRVI